jgi:hypothetical protein
LFQNVSDPQTRHQASVPVVLRPTGFANAGYRLWILE